MSLIHTLTTEPLGF